MLDEITPLGKGGGGGGGEGGDGVGVCEEADNPDWNCYYYSWEIGGHLVFSSALPCPALPSSASRRHFWGFEGGGGCMGVCVRIG